MGAIPLVITLYVVLLGLHMQISDSDVSAIRFTQFVAERPSSKAPDAAAAGSPNDIYDRVNKKVKARKAAGRGKSRELHRALELKREAPVVLAPDSLTSAVPLVDPTVLIKTPPKFEGNVTELCVDDNEEEMVDRLKVCTPPVVRLLSYSEVM
jgi:hypothetical protein